MVPRFRVSLKECSRAYGKGIIIVLQGASRRLEGLNPKSPGAGFRIGTHSPKLHAHPTSRNGPQPSRQDANHRFGYTVGNF